MKALFEVVILPVSDADRSLQFYRDQLGFELDVDYSGIASRSATIAEFDSGLV